MAARGSRRRLFDGYWALGTSTDSGGPCGPDRGGGQEPPLAVEPASRREGGAVLNMAKCYHYGIGG